MRNEDKIRLQHIIDACNEISEFIEGKSYKDLSSSRMLALSIIKDVEIIGEAANKISESLKEEYSQIPWFDIIGMRNRLIHSYFDIDMEIVWKTATEDIPELNNQILELLN